MTWDLILGAFPEGIETLDELPPGWIGQPFATGAEVLERIRELDPDATVNQLGLVDFGPFQVHLGALDAAPEVLSLTGAGNPAAGIPAVLELAARLGVRVLEAGSGTFLTSTESSGLREWTSYRDRVLQHPPQGPRRSDS
jgi:hypothetical protein